MTEFFGSVWWLIVSLGVLVMAAEDYTGPSNVLGQGPHPGPEFLSYYTTALADAGLSYDVYDVDAHSRTAPDPLGVLSHYKSVIWYTGNDLYVREPGQPGGTGNSKLMDDEVIAVTLHENEEALRDALMAPPPVRSF